MLFHKHMFLPLTFCQAVFTAYTNRKDIRQILRNVEDLFKDFTYTRVMFESDDRGVALMFSAVLHTKKGPIEIDGVDFFKLNQDGKATQLKVMIRPLSTTVQVSPAETHVLAVCSLHS